MAEQHRKSSTELNQVNEMAISKQQMIDKFEDQSEIYLEHITKLVYYGDISASWRQSIWNVVANVTGFKFKETHKLPSAEFIDKWLMEAAFGLGYLDDPINCIQSAMEGRLPSIIVNAKYPLPEPRTVDYPFAAQNVNAFNTAIKFIILSGSVQRKQVQDAIEKYLIVPQHKDFSYT